MKVIFAFFLLFAPSVFAKAPLESRAQKIIAEWRAEAKADPEIRIIEFQSLTDGPLTQKLLAALKKSPQYKSDLKRGKEMGVDLAGKGNAAYLQAGEIYYVQVSARPRAGKAEPEGQDIEVSLLARESGGVIKPLGTESFPRPLALLRNDNAKNLKMLTSEGVIYREASGTFLPEF